MRTLKIIVTTAVACACLVASAAPWAQNAPAYTQAQLDQMVAPIALYPDALLSQVLMAATYPLEIVEADRWLQANPGLSGPALDNALSQQTWDPSVISLCQVPSVLTKMSQNLQWTQDLGNAFLGQQTDVMNTAQKLRNEAYRSGNLQSTPQQRVIVEQQVVQIVPANPEVVYVPAYNPAVVYGAYWSYPTYYYPAVYAPSPGQVFANGIMWGVGFAIGNSLFGGCDWHDHNVYVNNNVFIHNNIYRNTNVYKNVNVNKTINVNKNVNINNHQSWNHSPEHRGNVPYHNDNLNQKYHGNPNGKGYERPGQGGAGTWQGNRPGQNGAGTRDMNKPGQNGAGTRDMNKPGQGGAGTWQGNKPGQNGAGTREMNKPERLQGERAPVAESHPKGDAKKTPANAKPHHLEEGRKR